MKEMMMTPRLNAFTAAPAPMKSWLDFSQQPVDEVAIG
jgi:hypothetical protein